MVRSFSFLVAIGIVGGAGVLHGLWTDRWVLSDEPQSTAAKLTDPDTLKALKVLGDWEAKEDLPPLDAQDQARAGIVSYLNRTYVNHHLTGSQVQVLLVCGRPGHISVHTPESCFVAAGYKMGPVSIYPTPDKAGAASDSFWCAEFVREGADPLRIYWAWNADGHWQASSTPRLAFARYRALFKLYLVQHVNDREPPAEEDPALGLMKELLPELKRCLFPKPLIGSTTTYRIDH